MFKPFTYAELITLAKSKDWSTANSIEQAVAKFAHRSGIDLTEATFNQEEHPLYRFLDNTYQQFYTSVDEVGKAQLIAGNHQSIASSKMEWFEQMVKAANSLFPSLAVVWEGNLILVDGTYRASARYVAGLRTVWTYTATKQSIKKLSVEKIQPKVRRDMIIKSILVRGVVEADDKSGKLEPLELEITDPYLISQVRRELI